MMKDFFKKISKNEIDDLDSGYNGDYYGHAYNSQPSESEHTDSPYDLEDAYRREEPANDYGHCLRTSYAPRAEKHVEPEVKTPVNAGTLYFVPETYKDGREDIVNALAESHVVVVNVKLLETADMVRMMDYIMGAVQVLEADMTRLNATAILLAPKGLEVTEDDMRSLLSGQHAATDAPEAAELVDDDEPAEDPLSTARGYDEIDRYDDRMSYDTDTYSY